MGPAARPPRTPAAASATQFFVFADTVAARSYSRTEEGHGWLGVRFQAAPLRSAVGDHRPRPDVGPRERAPAGGARHPRRQPAARRLLRPRSPRRPCRLPHGQPDAGPDGSGHDQVLGARVRGRRQPAHEPAAGPAAAHQRGAVLARRRGPRIGGAALSRPGARRARQLPPRDHRDAGHAGPGAGADDAGTGHGRPRAGRADGDDAAPPPVARRAGGALGLPGPGGRPRARWDGP